ncbi:MAG: DUF2076 domain-containing protein [Proteobacteria bacterium]|nr:DUF2076 domain-containing protein [Pseudomonadota bacterium]
MTPQERQLIDDLFDRIAKLEMGPRDADAERAIAAGAQRAPHALYALVQTALVQDEALKQAEARIRELTGANSAPTAGGFLDSMRSALGRGSVPSVPQAGSTGAGSAPDPRWNSGGAMPQSAPQYAPQGQPASPFNAAPQGGPSFLSTAASTAVGVIGGSLLFNALGGMFGGHRGGSAFADVPRDQGSGSPWGGNDNAAGSDLSRDAGLNDVGGDNRSAGLFDDGDSDNAGDYDVADSGDGGDFGGGDDTA